MIRYIFHRLASALLAVFFVITITFLLMHAIPGGPFASEKTVPPEIQKNLDARYHLKDPLWKQYVDYLNNMAHGDLGPSFKYQNRSVNELIREGFPVSATLGLLAVVFSLVVGIAAGIIAALYHNKWPDYLAMLLATIGFAVPSFILAGLLMFLFAYQLRWFPAAQWGSPSQTVLPALALAGMPTAVIARFIRSSLLEVMQQDYIRTARAKGLAPRVIIYRHGLRNAIMPVVTYLGPLVAGIFTGSFVVENIFAIPGLGQFFVSSISNRDYTVILGVTVFYSVFLVVMNLVVDLMYLWLDPRISLTHREVA